MLFKTHAKTKLTMTAMLVALASGPALADYTVTNENGDSLTLNGRFEVRYQDNGGDSDGVFNSGSSRIGLMGIKNFDNGWKGIGHAEWGINAGSNGNDIYDRLLYAGVEHDTYGKILVGTKQWSTFYDVAWFADLGRTYGSRASGYYNLADWGISSGLGRAENSITYRNNIGDRFKYGFTYQGTRSEVGLDGGVDGESAAMTLKNGMGGSFTYKVSDSITLGAAYHQNDLHDISTNTSGAQDGDTSRIALVGVNYSKDAVYLGLTHSQGDKSEVTTGGEFIKHHGTELYTHYHFDNGVRLTFNYNHLADKNSDYHRTTYTPGVEYHFEYNKFLVWAEYNINDSQDFYNAATGQYEGRDNAFSAGIRYYY